jgi:hypothetical protein
MKNFIFILLLIFGLGNISIGQVDDIKSASKGNKGSSGSDRGGSGGFNIFFVFDVFNGLHQWQMSTLKRREEIPSLVGLDFMLQAAIQPSSYYVVNPRVRGTFGIFSTDFRVNYLLEESISGKKDLITYDWQFVQLNFINHKNVVARIGSGVMLEGFGDKQPFSESSISLNFMHGDWGGFSEYRAAHDFDTDAVPRREFNLQVHRQVFESGHWHGFVSGGFQFQRYYSSINVWGIQLGMLFRLY